MVRGLSILIAFAIVLGALAYWGPLQLSVTGQKSKTTAEPQSAISPLASGSAAPAVSPGRQAEDPETASSARESVLAAAPANASPLALLPAKAIPGFPAATQTRLPNDQMAAAIKQAKLLRQQGQLVQARELLSEVYLGNLLSHDQRLRLAEELQPLCWELLSSHRDTGDGQLYEVQPGDMLIKLAKPFHVPPEFIMRINGLQNARSIRPRQTLKFVHGPFDVLIELSEYELTVLQHGRFVGRFSIGIGKDDSATPTGLFTVNDKQVNPIKWPDAVDRRKIPGGHPDNPFGSRWIGLIGTGYGYGMHGTVEPETIGQKASRGCIRMRNEDVEQLYDMLVDGSRVLIRS